ncbi:MAG: hypothetical protein G01um101433_564, partial [Parcubacteria group bacterium Gr01-1014_33]
MVTISAGSPATLRLYVDGHLVATDSNVYHCTTTAPLTIGVDPRDLVGEYFNGLIDEVRIYSETLTAYKIQQLYVQQAPKHRVAENR